MTMQVTGRVLVRGTLWVMLVAVAFLALDLYT
jgi:hypothetical protein